MRSILLIIFILQSLLNPYAAELASGLSHESSNNLSALISKSGIRQIDTIAIELNELEEDEESEFGPSYSGNHPSSLSFINAFRTAYSDKLPEYQVSLERSIPSTSIYLWVRNIRI